MVYLISLSIKCSIFNSEYWISSVLIASLNSGYEGRGHCDFQTFLRSQYWEFGVGSNDNPVIDVFLCFHHSSAWYYIDIVTHGIWRVMRSHWSHLRPSGTLRKKNQIPEIAYFCKFLGCILGKYQPRQLIRRHFWKKKNSAVLASYLCS